MSRRELGDVIKMLLVKVIWLNVVDIEVTAAMIIVVKIGSDAALCVG